MGYLDSSACKACPVPGASPGCALSARLGSKRQGMGPFFSVIRREG